MIRRKQCIKHLTVKSLSSKFFHAQIIDIFGMGGELLIASMTELSNPIAWAVNKYEQVQTPGAGEESDKCLVFLTVQKR